MKHPRSSTVAGALSVILALAASLWLAFWPTFYQGVEAKPDSQGTVRTSASLIEVNGYWVALLLLIPVALAVAGLLAARAVDYRRSKGKLAVWAPAAMSLLFCFVGLFSIGLLYIPSAGALVATAVLASRRPGTP